LLKNSKVKNEYEVSFYLQIIPINILLDQFTLHFLLNFFKIKVDNTIIESEEKGESEMKRTSEQHDISQINSQMLLQSPGPTKESYNEEKLKFVSRRIIVHDFFINFCYNTQKLSLERIKRKEILEYMNISNINDLKLKLKHYDTRNKKPLLDVVNDIYNYWKNDIMKTQIVNAYLSSISIIRPFKNIVGGFVEIFKQPYQNYKNDRSIQDGIAKGVKNFVVSFSTESLTVGEKVIYYM
jgi:hypothetical protein